MCVLLISASRALGALVVGRVDNFDDGSIQGWSSSADHINIDNGGPDGVGDNYLQIYRPTDSAPFPFHLGTKNTTTWTGDYILAGIQAIVMDVNTISITSGPVNLSLRIVLFGPGGAFSSKEPVTVITEDGWQHIEFGLARSDLVRILGAGAGYLDPGPDVDDLTATLRDVSTLLIRHDPASSPTPVGKHPEHILATLGIDNITAVLGPAPNVVLDNNKVGWKAQLSTLAHGVSGVVEILDVDTLLIESFNYDGGGSEVYFNLAPENTYDSFLTGQFVGSQLAGNVYSDDTVIVDLPPGLTIDDYNAVSVWSVDSAVNFGSGTFGSVVQYEVIFDASWSAETHLHFPPNPHFSGLIGGTHNNEVVFWQLDEVASDGVENMAETGSKSPLNSEVNKAIRNGSAYSVISGGGIGRSPGSTSTMFEMNSSHPFATVVSMIAPSPDWFVGVSGLKLFQDGRWLGEVILVLDPYDAGTDSGINFTSVNDDTNPPDNISLLTDFPFEDNVPLGTFTFRLLCPNPPTGDINGDCRVDFSDLTLLLSNWMLDCNLDPTDPACP
jgi:hypothetical protein